LRAWRSRPSDVADLTIESVTAKSTTVGIFSGARKPVLLSPPDVGAGK
jgi:hypothetical protein